MSLRLGCQVVTYGNVNRTIKYSMLTEKCGFDVVSFPDHLFHPVHGRFLREPAWDVFTILGAIGVRTSRVRLLMTTDSVRRHPAVIAHEIATLDQITNGRIILGIGAGELFTFAPIKDIIWDKPFTRFKEAISVIKGLWASTREDPFTFKGEYFKLEDAFLGLKPIQKPHPPIYIAGYGPKMRRLVGKIGDGWVLWMSSPRVLKNELKEVEEAARKYGRSLDDIDVAVIVQTAVLEDSDEAWKIVSSRVRLSLPMRAELLKALGYEDLAKEALQTWETGFTKEQVERIASLAEKIPMDAVKEVSVAGAADEAIEQIERFKDAGVNLLIALPMVDKFEETIKEYRRKIIPYFKSLP